MLFVLPSAIAGIVTILLITAVLRKRVYLPLDFPNHRSLHKTPTPRIGGLAMMCGILSGSVSAYLLVIAELPLSLLLIAFSMAAVSFIDDWRGLAIHWRFLAHLIAAGLFMFLFSPSLPYWQAGLLLIAIIWMINLYNFMDGSDGLAGGMALFGFSAYAVAAWMAGDAGLAALSLLIAASALGFLIFNFSPARVFMGDAGSIPLGFLAAALGLLGWIRGYWPLWFPLLVFSPFVADASITLVRRLLRRERIWQAHKTHYYQRLIQLGWGHRKMALWEYALMAVCIASAIWGVRQEISVQWLILGFWSLTYIVLARLVHWREAVAGASKSRKRYIEQRN